MDLFSERKRKRAMEALNNFANSELLIANAAKALGVKMNWSRKVSKRSQLPLVTLELENTKPKLKFVGYDLNDAATNCVNYLKLTLLEKEKVPDLLNFK